MNNPRQLSDKQRELAEAIHADFIQTYPGTPFEKVHDEMLAQVQGNEPQRSILGIWVQDHLSRLGVITGRAK